jgi:hypothetical protein
LTRCFSSLKKKRTLTVAALCLAVLLVNDAGTIALHDLRQALAAAPRMKVGTDTGSGVWAVIDNPVKLFISAHSTGLPVSASTVYTLWAVTGAAAWVLGFITRGTGWRMTWVLWGSASVAMVWENSPAAGRTIATGIAVLAWSMASAFALRGIHLRPQVSTSITNPAPQFAPVVNIPAPVPPGDLPDNVTPLTKH